jgi:splicing factor U2AF subunit
MFPLPGAPRQQAMDPSKLQSMLSSTGGGADRESLKPSNARQSKRLFIHNIPPAATEDSIISFFNLQLNGLNVVSTNDPCISCQMSKNRDFALIEFKNPSEATMALALDGISMEAEGMANGDGTNGAASGLSIRRPKDYIVAGESEEEAPADGVVSSDVKDTPNKLSITSILPTLDDEQVRELVSSFGTLRSFVLVKDRSTEESRGIAFCEFVDKNNADMAVEGLNSLDLGGKFLKCQRASIGVAQATGLEMSVNAMSMLAGTQSDNVDEGRVLQLLNMVTAEELINDEDYEGEIYQTLRYAVKQNGLTGPNRNRRGRQGGVRKVRPGRRHQGAPSQPRQQAVQRRGQDLHQVRQRRLCQEGAAVARRQEVCRQDGRHDLLFRGELRGERVVRERVAVLFRGLRRQLRVLEVLVCVAHRALLTQQSVLP